MFGVIVLNRLPLCLLFTRRLNSLVIRLKLVSSRDTRNQPSHQ